MFDHKLLSIKKSVSPAFWLLTALLTSITLLPGVLMAQLSTESTVVISTISAPDKTVGLAWDRDSGSLWTSIGHSGAVFPGTISNIDTDGNIITSFDAAGQSGVGPHNCGLAFDGTYLWNVDYYDKKIYKMTKSGAVVDSIPSPSGRCSGIAWDGSSLWVSSWDDCKIHKINPQDGTILAALTAPNAGTSYPFGLAWDGSNLWVSNNRGVYAIEPQTGKQLAFSDDSVLRYGGAYGLTWDGESLWGGSWTSNEIFKIDVSSFAVNSLPLPTYPETFSYIAQQSPVLSPTPSASKPMGVGSIACEGDYVDIELSLLKFSGPVDIYFGVHMPGTDSGDIYLLTPGNGLRPLGEVGFVPWKTNEEGFLDQSIFGVIPKSRLPSGKYTLYLMVTPQGTLSENYIWTTTFTIPDVPIPIP